MYCNSFVARTVDFGRKTQDDDDDYYNRGSFSYGGATGYSDYGNEASDGYSYSYGSENEDDSESETESEDEDDDVDDCADGVSKLTTDK